MSDTLNSEEASQLLKCSTQWVGELARNGEIPATQVGGQWIFVKELLMDWLREKSRNEQAARREAAHLERLAGRTPAPASGLIQGKKNGRRNRKIDVRAVAAMHGIKIGDS